MLRDMNTIHAASPEDISAASVILSLMVKAGHCLEMEPVRNKRLQAQIKTLEGYTSIDPVRKERIVAAMRTNMEHTFADAGDRMASRLKRQVREAIDLHSGGNPKWLASFVEGVVYSALPTPSAYRAFEARVLAAYRCPVTGRYPPGLSRPC
jgi:hypothetical protein